MRLGLLESVTQLNSHALPDLRELFLYKTHQAIPPEYGIKLKTGIE